MASSDKLWFEMGVRENVSKTLTDIMDKAEELQETLDSMKIGQEAIRNAAELERAFDKIAMARERISEARGLTTNKKELDDLDRMEKELGKIFKKLEDFTKMGSDLDLAKMGSKGFAKFLEEQYNLLLALDQIKRKTGEINEQAREDERNKIAEAKRIDELQAKYFELLRVKRELSDAILSAAPGVDITNAKNSLKAIESKIIDVFKSLGSGGAIPDSAVGAKYTESLRQAKEETKGLTAATDEYNKKLSTTEGIQNNLERLMLDTESQKTIAGIRKQTVEYNALSTKLREIEDLKRRVDAEQIQIKNGTITTPTYTREAINKEIDAIQRRYNESLARGKQLEKDDAEAKRERAASSKKTAEAISLLVHANNGLISSYNRIAQSGKQANNVTIQLQQQIGQYTSLFGMERLLKSVVTIGGQFEFQHIALQNILGDLQQANILFGQLQNLAIESPKTFMELTAYTKQLSAYQIPYNELFETTKRLADLSTGLGVDMSRLILAYGQVRSAAVLRGQELRQFTEAGIPLVQKLAEEFTRLNGKVTTTGEVFSLISKRAVPFEMVKKILWDMTSEGGQFFNMQAELADTLYGKWQKLQDQWQITLGHIADANSRTGAFLKFLLEGLIKVTAAFDKLIPVLGGFAIGKTFNSAFTGMKELTRYGKEQKAMSNWLIAKQERAAQLDRERIMYGKQLNAEEKKLIKHKNELVSNDYYLLASEKQISMHKANQLYLDKQLNKAHYNRLLMMEGYTAEQRKQILNGNASLLRNEGGMFKNIWKGVYNFMGGWVGIAMTTLGVIASLYSNAEQKAEEARESAMAASNAMLTPLKDANSLYTELSKSAPEGIDDINAAINRMTSALKESGNYSKELQDSLGATDDITEKYEILYEQLRKVSDEYLRSKEIIDAYLEAANRVGEGNWLTRMFNDPMSEDLQDLSKAFKEKLVIKAKISINEAALRTEIESFLKSIGKWSDKEFAKLNSLQIYDKLGELERRQFREHLDSNAHDFNNENKKSYMELADAVGEYDKALGNVKKQLKEVDSQMGRYVKTTKEGLAKVASEQGLDLSALWKWKSSDLRKFNGWLNDILKSLNVDSETEQHVRNAILATFPGTVTVRINALPKIDTKTLSDWQQELKDYFSEHKINITVDAQSSLESIEKDLQNKRQAMQDQMDRAGEILVSVGLDLSNLPKDINSYLPNVPVWKQYNVVHAFEDYNEGKNGTAVIDTAGKDLGLTVTKDKDKNRNRNNIDQQAKELREYIRMLNEAEKSFQYWRKSVGDVSASLHVNTEFGDELERLSKLLGRPVDFKNIDEYKKSLEDIKQKYQAIYDASKKAGRNRPELLQAIKEVDKTLADIERKDFEKQSQEFASSIKRELDAMNRSWEAFKKTLDATGDKDIAIRLSGVEYSFGLVENFADELKKKIEEDFANAGAITIPLDIKYSDKEIENLVQQAFSESRPKKNDNESDEEYSKRLMEYEARISGIVEEVKKWRDLQTSLQDNAITAYAKLMTDAQSLTNKLKSINKEYEDQIKNLRTLLALPQGTPGKITQDEYDEAVRKADTTRKINVVETVVSEVDWGQTDMVFGKIFTEAGDILGKKLKEYIGSPDFLKLDATQQKKYYDLQNTIRKADNTSPNPLNVKSWKDLADKTRTLQEAFKDLIDATFELEEAKEMEAGAERELANAKETERESGAQSEYNNAVKNRVESEKKVQESQERMQDANQEYSESQQKLQKATSDFSSTLSELTSGKLSDFVKGIIDITRLFEGKSVTETLAQALGGIPDGYAQIIAAVLSILDMLKDDAPKFFKDLLDGIFDAIVGLIKSFFNGELFEAITEAAIEGLSKMLAAIIEEIPNMFTPTNLGGVLEGVFKGIGNTGSAWADALGSFGIDVTNSNADEVQATIAALTEENKRLEAVIEDNTKILKESNGQKAIDAAQKAKQAQEQENQNILNKWKEAMGYHYDHHSNAATFDLFESSVNQANDVLAAMGSSHRISSTTSWEDLLQLSPEEMKQLRTYAPDFWADLTSEGAYDWAYDFLNEYADQAGKVEEINKQLYQNLTLLTVEGLHDTFLNELMDMDKSAADFSKDFSKMLMKAVLNAQIANLLDGEIKEWYNKLSEYLAKHGGTLTPEEVEKLRENWLDISEKGMNIRDWVAELTGYTGDESESGLSNGIKGITEKTADLLASYINAIRADVAANRQTLQEILLQLIGEQMQNNQDVLGNPFDLEEWKLHNHGNSVEEGQQAAAERGLIGDLPEIARAQLAQLQLIAGNTKSNAESAEAIFNLLKSNIDNGNRFHIA